MSTSPGAQSPFDNSQPTVDLSANGKPTRHDPNATQPLPVTRTSGSGRLAGAGSVLGGLQSGNAAPTGSNVFDPPDDDAVVSPPPAPRSTSSTQAAPTGRLPWLPMPTLIGLAVVGGALIVALVPAMLRRVIPTVPMKQFPSETIVRESSRAPVAMPQSPSVALKPLPEKPALDGAEQLPSARVNADEAPADNLSDGDRPATSDATRTEMPTNELPATDAGESVAAADAPQRDAKDSNDDEASRERFAVTERRRSSKQTRDTEAPAAREASQSSAAFVHPRSGYAISPPAGFKRQRTGRRTIWRGPGGAQLLVETTTAPGTSARADWERLSAALAKKYGRNYRSLGIRETTLAGRPAAIWEFEISSKRGTTRKIDVAVHERGRGYAVLAEAPASRFDELRPQLEAAIASFQPPARDAMRAPSSPSRSSSRNRRDESRERDSRDKRDSRDEEDETEKARRESREEGESFSQPGY